MFNNPGSKIKRLGEIVFWLALIAFEAFALNYVLTESKNVWRNFDFLYFLLLAVVYPLSAYISSLFLVAFGELVEKTENNNLMISFIVRRLAGTRRKRGAEGRPETEQVFDGPDEEENFS